MSYSGPIIDTDVHNTLSGVEELFPYVSAYRKNYLKTLGMPVTPHCYRSPVGVLRADAMPPNGNRAGSDPAHLLSHHMDPTGTTYGILTGELFPISVQADIDMATEVCSAYNDALEANWLDFSDRFRGSITINHADPAGAAKEIDRKGKDKRFVQVLMCSGARHLFGTRHYHPIYEAAERNGLPIAFHSGAEGAGTCTPPTPSGYPSLYFEWHNIVPTNFMAQINSLVCEGAFEKFPKLKVIALEGGIAWLPHLMWRMDKNYKALRAMTPWLKRLPSEYIIEHVRISTQPIEEPPRKGDLLHIFEMISADKTIVFASDYPHWDNDDPRHVLNEMPEPMQERIYWGNAAELYHLAPPAQKKVEENAPSLSRV